jgi:hypothetical protein
VSQPSPAVEAVAAAPGAPDTRGLYLNLMKRSLLDLIYEPDPEARKKRQIGADFQAGR